MVHVFMIGGVLLGSLAFPALLFSAFEGGGTIVPAGALAVATGLVLLALWLSPTAFSPDYLMVMRMLGGALTSFFFFSRRS
jgi:hypothetical protein